MRLPPEESGWWVTSLPQAAGFAVMTSIHSRQWAVFQLAETGFVDREHFADLVRAAAGELAGLAPFTAGTDQSEASPGVHELFLHLTTRCNLTCRHCYYLKTPRRPSEDLSLSAIEDLIDTLRNHGLRKVTLSGGEPLLHPRFRQVLQLIHQAGLAIMVLTNGTQVDEDFAKLLAPEDWVLVSLHGSDASSHERQMGAGAFERVVASLKLLRDARPADRLVVNCTMTDWNVDRLEEMADLVASLGLAQIRFMPLHTVSGEPGAGPHLAYRSAAMLRWARVAAEGIAGGRWPARVMVGLTGLPGYLNEQSAGEQKHVCGVGRQLTVSSDGSLYPCPCLMDNDFRLGEPGTSRKMEEVFSRLGQWEKTLQARRSTIPACRRCPFASICQGGCPALAFQTTGSFRRVDPLCRAVREYSLAYFSALARRSVASGGQDS